MNSFQLVIRSDHEKGEKGLPDGKEVVSWLPFEGGEGVVSLFEKAGDFLWSHCLGFNRGLGESGILLGEFGIYSRTRGVFFLASGAGQVLERIAMMTIKAIALTKAS